MRKSLVGLVLMTTPVAADPVADFQQLLQTVPTLSLQNAPDAQVAWARNFVATLSGKWVQIGPVMGEATGFPDADIFAKTCEKIAYTVKPKGEFSFALEMPAKIMPFVIDLQWAGGTRFVAQYDEESLLARMFGDQRDNIDDNMLYSVLVNSIWNGPVSFLPAGEDLILMQNSYGQIDVLARCP
jgi:hypothetical protein